jgi:hypothetical protein
MTTTTLNYRNEKRRYVRKGEKKIENGLFGIGVLVHKFVK